MEAWENSPDFNFDKFAEQFFSLEKEPISCKPQPEPGGVHQQDFIPFPKSSLENAILLDEEQENKSMVSRSNKLMTQTFRRKAPSESEKMAEGNKDLGKVLPHLDPSTSLPMDPAQDRVFWRGHSKDGAVSSEQDPLF